MVKYIRQYVMVNSVFDRTGEMSPREIIWKDGRKFQIECIRDVKPVTPDPEERKDCYTVIIAGQTKQLFFERLDQRIFRQPGRWFVKIPQYDN